MGSAQALAHFHESEAQTPSFPSNTFLTGAVLLSKLFCIQTPSTEVASNVKGMLSGRKSKCKVPLALLKYSTENHRSVIFLPRLLDSFHTHKIPRSSIITLAIEIKCHLSHALPLPSLCHWAITMPTRNVTRSSGGSLFSTVVHRRVGKVPASWDSGRHLCHFSVLIF